MEFISLHGILARDPSRCHNWAKNFIEAYSDINTIIGENERSIRGCELGLGHCDVYINKSVRGVWGLLVDLFVFEDFEFVRTTRLLSFSLD